MKEKLSLGSNSDPESRVGVRPTNQGRFCLCRSVFCVICGDAFRPKASGHFPTQGTHFLTFINLGFALSRCVFLASVWGRFAGLGVGVARGEHEGASEIGSVLRHRRNHTQQCGDSTQMENAYTTGRRGPPNTTMYVYAVDAQRKGCRDMARRKPLSISRSFSDPKFGVAFQWYGDEK